MMANLVALKNAQQPSGKFAQLGQRNESFDQHCGVGGNSHSFKVGAALDGTKH